MIIFDDKTNTFILRTKRTAYAIWISRRGFLHHLYYGADISDTDVVYLAEKYAKPLELAETDGWWDMRANEMPCEYSSFGRGDYHDPSILIERTDGAAMSRLRYLSHTVTDGAKTIDGMPHARRGQNTLSIVLKDDFSSAEITLNYTVIENIDVIVRNVEIKNVGDMPLRIKKAFSFVLDLPENDYKIMKFSGDLTSERVPEISDIGHGIVRLQSIRGASSHQMNPFAVFLKDGTTEERGECIGVQLIYSGSFAITAEGNSNDGLRIQGGINDTQFCYTVNGGDVFVTPQAAICYSRSGLGDLSREYADFLRECIIDPRHVYEPRPIVVNSWEAVYFDCNYEKLYPIIDEAAKLGIDTFVLDDGWFGKRNWDDSSLGDWYVNTNKLDRGLTPIIDRCKKRGLKFGLWFEPEMVSPNSELYRAHPEWAIGKVGQPPCQGRNQLVLDFSDPNVVEHIYKAVSGILRDNDISYVKWDMNRNMSEFYSEHLPSDRQGEVAHRYMLGVYSLAERLTKDFSDVFFEGCASGGGRFDAGMLFYFPQIWTSDNTDGYCRALIQYGTSFGYPLSSMSCHVSTCPNHQTGRTTPFFTRGAIASLGAMGYELDFSKSSEEEKKTTAQQIAKYKNIRDLILRGDLYRLSDPYNGDLFCVCVVAKDKSQAYVVGEVTRKTPNDCKKKKFIKLNGLDPAKKYNIPELDITASGAVLSQFGIECPKLDDYGAFIWHIDAV